MDGQPAPPRFAPVMAPMMPMMPLPFGMEYGHGSAAGHLAPPYGPTPTWPQLMGAPGSCCVEPKQRALHRRFLYVALC